MKRTDQAYEAIKSDIISCSLAPGSQVSQSQLMGQYDFGLASIREALQKLEKEGLVVPIPRAGYIIHPITLADIHEIYELRASLEVTAARLACQKGSQAQLRRLMEMADFSYTFGDPQSYSEYLYHNAAFHCAIAEASGNRRLVALISHLMDELIRVLHLGLEKRNNATKLHEGHQELARAIASGNPDEAERVAREQVDFSMRIIQDTLTQTAWNRIILTR